MSGPHLHYQAQLRSLARSFLHLVNNMTSPCAPVKTDGEINISSDRQSKPGVCCSGLLEYGVSVAGDSERMSGQAALATPRPAPVGLATVLRATVQPGGLSDSTYILPGHTGHNCCLKYQTGHLTVLSSTLYMGQASTT